jgi:hypothetical protein
MNYRFPNAAPMCEGFRGPRANAGTGVRRELRRMDADDHPRTAPLPVEGHLPVIRTAAREW